MHLSDQPARSLAHLARERARTGADRPFLTFHDTGTGERTELGHATFANWAAKTANLLVTDLELDRGATVSLALGGHWAAAVVAVAAWQAGLVVDLAGRSPAAVTVVREDLEPLEADATFVVGRAVDARLTTPTAAGEEFAGEVLAQEDDFTAPELERGDTAVRAARGGGTVDLTHGALVDAAGDVAVQIGLVRGSRLLCTLPVDRLDGLLAGLVAVLVVDARLVLAPGAGTATAGLAGAERCTHALVADDRDAAGLEIPAATCAVATAPALHTTCERVPQPPRR